MSSPASEQGSSSPTATKQLGPTWTPVPWKAVTIDDSFWTPHLQVNREQMLPLIYQISQETGRIDNFRLNWKPGMEPTPHIFWDSDVAKWLEAASYSLATHPDPVLETQVDEVISLIAGAQQPDGYLNTYFTVVEPTKRWTNLRDWHELYCAGHLIEAAVAHFQATGKHVLLDVMCRYADYIDTIFGTASGKKRGYPGHEEIELALVKLYRVTGEKRYLQLSEYFVNERGRQPHYFDREARQRGEDPTAFHHKTHEYSQAHLPVREQHEAVGHAVRAMYLYSAMADLARELHDQSLFDADQRLWDHLCTTRLYLTSGLGPSRHNEGFTRDYDLPNETAYAETCAAIGFVFWNHRMLQLDCNARYADMLERALYNGVLSGVSLDGHRFFYENPLASLGTHHREKWFRVACCPPNIARLLASLGQYIYATNDTDLAVHLYIQSTVQMIVGGRVVTVQQETTYPWNGTITLRLGMDEPSTFGLRLRIPGWCRNAQLKVIGIFRTAYFVPVIIGLSTASYIWIWMFNNQVGIFDGILRLFGIPPIVWLSTGTGALFAVIVMIVWKTSGFTMVLLMMGLQSIPTELYEADRIDGANRWQELWNVTLPLMRRSFALALVLSVIGSYLAFDQFYIMTQGGPQGQTITIVFWIFTNSFTFFKLGYGAAMSIVLLIILLIISALQLYLLRDNT